MQTIGLTLLWPFFVPRKLRVAYDHFLLALSFRPCNLRKRNLTVRHLRFGQERIHAASCNPQNHLTAYDESQRTMKRPKLCYSHRCARKHRHTMNFKDFSPCTNYLKTQFLSDPNLHEFATVKIQC